VTEETVNCGACGLSLSEASCASEASSQPCPACGSHLRHFTVSAQETLTLREQLSVTVREEGLKRPVQEELSGNDLQKKTGKWMKRQRVIDRKIAPPWYEEKIVNPETDEVVRFCSEPLKDHQGRGSARGKEIRREGYEDSMYMPKEKNTECYEYWECKVFLGDYGTLVGQGLRKMDQFMAEQCRRRAPNEGDGWILDHIIVTGSMILPGEEPLGRIFVFRRQRVRA